MELVFARDGQIVTVFFQWRRSRTTYHVYDDLPPVTADFLLLPRR